MIYIDDRAGSGTLLSLFQSHRTRPAVTLRRLPAADFCFSGHGPKGPCLIGVERKTIRDMLQSIRTGRFSGEQLPKLLDHYEFAFLTVEGRVRINTANGFLEEPWGKGWTQLKLGQSPFLGLELDSFLTTIEVRTPIHIHCTRNEAETVEDTLSLHHYFAKPWDKHHAHVALHLPPETATIGKAGTVRRIAYCLGGVGWDRSAAAAQSFKMVAHPLCGSDQCPVPPDEGVMVRAEPKDWSKLNGFGKVLSKRVWQELHGQFDSGDGLDL